MARLFSNLSTVLNSGASSHVPMLWKTAGSIFPEDISDGVDLFDLLRTLLYFPAGTVLLDPESDVRRLWKAAFWDWEWIERWKRPDFLWTDLLHIPRPIILDLRPVLLGAPDLPFSYFRYRIFLFCRRSEGPLTGLMYTERRWRIGDDSFWRRHDLTFWCNSKTLKRLILGDKTNVATNPGSSESTAHPSYGSALLRGHDCIWVGCSAPHFLVACSKF